MRCDAHTPLWRKFQSILQALGLALCHLGHSLFVRMQEEAET